MMRSLFLSLVIMLISLPAMAEEQTLLRLHGSNTIGAALAPAMVKAWLTAKEYHSLTQEETAPQEMVIHATSREGEAVKVTIKAHGSSTSFKALDAGATDIGMASRAIKPKEVEMLASMGKMDSHNCEYVLGLDGIAVIVNRDNPLKQVDKADLARIFSGEVSDWSELGFDGGAIHVYARDDKSGTYDTFKHLVLGKHHPLVPTAKRFESNAKLSDAVSVDPHGIGFVGLPYIRQSKALAVADGGMNAISPDTFTVATEDYALARRLFLYLPEKPVNTTAKEFINFTLSQAGQKVVAETGFISQEIVTGTAVAAGKINPEYKALIDGARRLSLNFRFHRGSAFLDNKARQDVKRLVAYMSRKENTKRELILIGFSDRNEVIPMHSLGLSIQRADGVADVLINHGLSPRMVRGLGSVVSVASNETSQGREKNRRVEVWVR